MSPRRCRQAARFYMALVLGDTALDCVGANFTGADADHLVDRGDEDLAVARLAGARRLMDRFDDRFDLTIVYYGFDFHLGEEIDHVLGTAIELGMAFLATEAFHFGNGDAGYTGLRQCFAHVVELERPDYGCNQFHGVLVAVVATRAAAARRVDIAAGVRGDFV